MDGTNHGFGEVDLNFIVGRGRTPADGSPLAKRGTSKLFSVMFIALLVASVAALVAFSAGSARAAVPNGFVEGEVAGGLTRPTSMAFAPDGRIFVTEQTGAVRVIKRSAQGDYGLLQRPFARVGTAAEGERGLLGVAFDPQFAANKYVYVYHTVPATSSRPAYNRIVRFTADPDKPSVAAPGRGRVIFRLDYLSAKYKNHNGGALHFGSDGKLYVAVGDNRTHEDPTRNAQTLNTTFGKMLRINKDGTIPTDNPFYDRVSGRNRTIWARGLRNPFSFAVQPGTGKIYINDVGSNEQIHPIPYEEINEGAAGANYGWPIYEGTESDPEYQDPTFAYRHGDTGTMGCAITGGTFYNPATSTYPQGYVGDYFFADFCNGWIRRYDPGTDRAFGFATGIDAPVDLDVFRDGDLYYLSRGSFGSPDPAGSVHKVSYKAP